jgi:O-antigen ligase
VTGVAPGLAHVPASPPALLEQPHIARMLTLATAGVALCATAFASIRAPEPAIALVMLGGLIMAAALRPICGVFGIIFFTLVGDYFTASWYPFARTLSMRESVLFLSDGLTLSPLEIVIAATFAFWLIDVMFTPGARVRTGPIFAPLAVFTAFVAFGFVYGIGRGGDLRAALFEGRAMFVMLPTYLLIVNLCDHAQLRRLVWTAVAAIVINAILSLQYLLSLNPAEREMQEDLGEHSASVHFAFLFVLTLTLFLYRGGSRITRWVLLSACAVPLVVFFNAERRSAVVGLGMGVMMVFASLWWRNKSKFFLLVPVLVIVTVGYSAAFWNSTSAAAFPVQAIKTVVAPDEISADDRNSGLYRVAENANLNYTVRSEPLTGLGFGQKFLRPYALADISFFMMYEYIPHNSILWVWVKTGFFGFLSMLLVFATAVKEGARRVVSTRDPTKAALAMVGAANVAIFAVFAFVDIAWDARSMVFLGLSFAMCSVVPPAEAEPDRDLD